MRNNMDNQLINQIKTWLDGEIADANKKPYDEGYSREQGILDGRHECAIGLLIMIKKWERDNG